MSVRGVKLNWFMLETINKTQELEQQLCSIFTPLYVRAPSFISGFGFTDHVPVNRTFSSFHHWLIVVHYEKLTSALADIKRGN